MLPNEFGLKDSGSQNKPPTPVEQCEVLDFELLAKYRSMRAKWLSWYNFQKDDPNNIEGQIIDMTFRDMSYRMLAKPRGDAAPNVEIAARNGILAHMLDQGYAAIQVLAIRRLLDKRSDVNSIQRLLDDIQSNRDLLTRENYVAHDGKPYDPEGWRSMPERIETLIWGVDAPGLHNYVISKVRHELFDKLSGVPEENRTRTDKIQSRVFERLHNWLRSVEAEKLITLSHKFFAHAADMTSRGTLTYSGVLLMDIDAAQKAIIRVERAITDDILFIGVGREVVAMRPLGFLNALDKVYVTSEMIPKMDEHWKQLKAERNSWSKGYEDELYA
jgi:hypothetical protein